MSNTTNTPKDALDWAKAEEDQLKAMDAIEYAEEALRQADELGIE
jgi:hypothetical protein|nr:MAG TPA: hypothetical protein [Caudoviricetes sp.]